MTRTSLGAGLGVANDPPPGAGHRFRGPERHRLGPGGEPGLDPPPGAEPPARAGPLYALADGMGGLAHGKLASSMAVDAMFESIYSGRAPVPRCMGKGVELANSKVVGAAMNQGNARMGTTLTAANLSGDEPLDRPCGRQQGLPREGGLRPSPDERPHRRGGHGAHEAAHA